MRFAVLLLALGIGGCDHEPKPVDMATIDMALDSQCGHPGDRGNSKGVGKFCTDSSMCSGQAAAFCSTVLPTSLGKTYFCTLPCKDAADQTTCGEAASCICVGAGACGCVPDDCAASHAG